MRDAKVTLIPSMSFNYEDNLLESVGIGGELYRRETPLIAENARLRAENAKLLSMRDEWQANDASLRELVRDLYRAWSALCDSYAGSTCAGCPASKTCDTDPVGRMRELGMEDG